MNSWKADRGQFENGPSLLELGSALWGLKIGRFAVGKMAYGFMGLLVAGGIFDIQGHDHLTGSDKCTNETHLELRLGDKGLRGFYHHPFSGDPRTSWSYAAQLAGRRYYIDPNELQRLNQGLTGGDKSKKSLPAGQYCFELPRPNTANKHPEWVLVSSPYSKPGDAHLSSGQQSLFSTLNEPAILNNEIGKGDPLFLPKPSIGRFTLGQIEDAYHIPH